VVQTESAIGDFLANHFQRPVTDLTRIGLGSLAYMAFRQNWGQFSWAAQRTMRAALAG
jgi:hypothetical protein